MNIFWLAMLICGYKINDNLKTCEMCPEKKRLASREGGQHICDRCKDKQIINIFSEENNMYPGKHPTELSELLIIEQQFISRHSFCMNIIILKQGGIGSIGHCVTFPQDVDEPVQILARVPKDLKVIKVLKKGANDTSKECRVRRYKVQEALKWLKLTNPVYKDITISQERLDMLPIDEDLKDISQ